MRLLKLDALDDGRHRAEFYRMWRAGYSAGFTHVKSFETMGKRESGPSEEARQTLLEGARRGADVVASMRRGGVLFEEFERALLALGEESGRFEQSLTLLGDFYSRKHKLMLWVKKKIAYPFFTALFACFIAPLPLLFSGRTTLYAALSLGGVALLLTQSGAIVMAVSASYGKKPPLARARFARALATAIEAGLPLPKSIRLAADASANPEIRAYVKKIPEIALASKPISETMSSCPHMTLELLAVIETAEGTGDYSALKKLSELYEDGFR